MLCWSAQHLLTNRSAAFGCCCCCCMVLAAWHGVNESLKNCSGCPQLNMTLGDIRKCPNPAACFHEPKYLVELHPNSQRKNRLSWLNYGTQLCNYADGYEGVLCGVCTKGWGQTAPFKCNRCVGAEFLPDGTSAHAAVQPGPARISLLYLTYWLVLTAWMLLTVRFSMRSAGLQQTNKPPGRAAAAHAALAALASPAAKAPPAEAAPASAEKAPQVQAVSDASPCHRRQDQGNAQATGPASCAAKPPTKELSKAVDITKVRGDPLTALMCCVPVV